MPRQVFAQHVADLLRRDGCTGVVVRQARSERNTGITGRTAAGRTADRRTVNGRTAAVPCRNRSDRWTVPGADPQKFAGAARAVNRVDLALSVATCDFSHESQAIAALTGGVTVNRGEVGAWTAGVRLKALRQGMVREGPKPQEKGAASGLRPVGRQRHSK
ncbi:restriction endonuclease [Streptomyces sp. NPDC057433]|uniref:restriction endonuclease n=1 Tax=Streptomyces sp. NPDC057433 TaxID=3346132 RepID=UPI0036764899